MNMQCRLIQELTLHKFEVGYNIAKATKNICCTKGEDTVDNHIVQEIWQSGKVREA